MALPCGPLQCIARVHGPQTSCRAELMGLCVAAHLAVPGSTITIRQWWIMALWNPTERPPIWTFAGGCRSSCGGRTFKSAGS